MIEIVIPKNVVVGCYEYSIDASGKKDRELAADHRRAMADFTEHTIYIVSNLDKQDVMNCFCHEVVHCIDVAYFDQGLSEGTVAIMGNALHQVFLELGIRFVLKEQSDGVSP